MTDVLGADSLPFARYSGGGRTLLGRPRGGDACRTGYGPPVFAECGAACVYCGRDLAESYEAWLDVCIDHVIPQGTLKHLHWPADWVLDIANCVTSCRACNEFRNHDLPTDPMPTTLEEFFDLRDRHFLERRSRILARHEREREQYRIWRQFAGKTAEASDARPAV